MKAPVAESNTVTKIISALSLSPKNAYFVQVGVPGDIIASFFGEHRALGVHARVTDPHGPYDSRRERQGTGENPAQRQHTLTRERVHDS